MGLLSGFGKALKKGPFTGMLFGGGAGAAGGGGMGGGMGGLGLGLLPMLLGLGQQRPQQDEDVAPKNVQPPAAADMVMPPGKSIQQGRGLLGGLPPPKYTAGAQPMQIDPNDPRWRERMMGGRGMYP